MSLRPLADRVVVGVVKKEEKQEGLIVVLNKEPDKLEAVVLAVGSGKLLSNGTVIPVSVVVGDKVFIAVSAGIKLDVDGREVRVINEDEILAVKN